MLVFYFLFFFKQKTAYEMRISDWSSDVCSSDLREYQGFLDCHERAVCLPDERHRTVFGALSLSPRLERREHHRIGLPLPKKAEAANDECVVDNLLIPIEGLDLRNGLFGSLPGGTRGSLHGCQYGALIFDGQERSEEHPSELQSLMRNSYAVF